MITKLLQDNTQMAEIKFVIMLFEMVAPFVMGQVGTAKLRRFCSSLAHLFADIVSNDAGSTSSHLPTSRNR